VGRENISLFPGTTSMMTFLWGCDGVFSGYACFDPHGLIDLWNAVQKGDLFEARKIHFNRIRPLEEVIYVRPMVDLITKYKEVCCWTGLIPRATVKHRLPLLPEVRRKLYEGLKKTHLKIVRDFE
jgi:dihydrodipicolinate synthase/N-acetylneuraminate lyase